ncbi:MAG: hypothetical protein J7L88_06070, partial [Thermoplasmata archaeon]|nr:hypothetical protein [Thermoplasmata archaeon]
MHLKWAVQLSEFLSKPQNRFRVAAALFLYLSLLFGLIGGKLSTVGWLVFGILAFAFLYRSTPTFFFITWSLILIYAITFFGVYLYFAPEVGIITRYVKPLGAVLVLVSFTILIRFILYFKDLRDYLARDGRYVPVGLFSISAVLFFLFSLLSSFSWARWGTGGGGLALYTLSEVLLVPALIYLYYFPEVRLKGEGERGESVQWLDTLFRSAFRTIPRLLPPPRCPHCGKN